VVLGCHKKFNENHSTGSKVKMQEHMHGHKQTQYDNFISTALNSLRTKIMLKMHETYILPLLGWQNVKSGCVGASWNLFCK
jgi:hypothetical protein